MDPNQRLLLEVSYQALADAGYTRRALRGQNIGLFVGYVNGNLHIHAVSPVLSEIHVLTLI